VLVEARSQQRGTGHQVGQVGQAVQFGFKGRELGLFFANRQGLDLTLLPLQRIDLGRQFTNLAAADVFPNDAAVDLAGTTVVGAVPAHSVTSEFLPRMCGRQTPTDYG
jgi:hypothetical protein